MKNLKFFWTEFGDKKRLLLFLFSLALCVTGALLEGVSYSFLILAFTSLIDQKPLFFEYIVIAVGAQLAKSALCFCAQLLNISLGIRLQTVVQAKIFEKIFSFDFATCNQFKVGQLVEYVRSPVNFFRAFLELMGGVVTSCCLIVVSLILMSFISLPLTFLTLSLFSLALIFQKTIVKRSRLFSGKLSLELEQLMSLVVQTLGAIRIIHLYNGKKRAKKQLETHLQATHKFSKKLLMAQAWVLSLNEVLGIILVSVVLLSGVWLLDVQGGATIPLLLGFMTITYRLSGKVLGLMHGINQIAALSGSFKQIKTILQQESGPSQNSREEMIFEKTITFSHVTFRYPGTDEVVIDDFTTTIKKGEVVALVGSSGTGKSTLIDLLSGLYHPSGGHILIDDKILKTSNLYKWREKMAIVTQEPFLFNESLFENIRFGNAKASLDEVKEAAKSACAAEFIEKLPQGYDTVVGERGYRLSGGEKQRVALARALLRGPEILVLDEATSHLDSVSEKWIQEYLEKNCGDKTIILAAHRLSTLMHADQILVIEEGRLVEQGTHQELLNKEGIYNKFWSVQLNV